MDPPCYQTGSVALKGRNEGYPGPPAGPSGVQYTSVNMAPEAPEAPKDHVIWSIFNLIYCNPFCLGLTALIFSIKARDRKVAGDMNGARHYGSTARCLNIWATVLVSISLLILIIISIVIASHVIGIITSFNENQRSNVNYNVNYRG
ncbi:interferon-induced transmembrane protein 1-like [Pungitius pungitius]|uniref:interferon-induced transmembrane protein 1-like n=1 Tax=Pungitius pungitius TaxID=134920 RepID=UPI002E124F8B